MNLNCPDLIYQCPVSEFKKNKIKKQQLLRANCVQIKRQLTNIYVNCLIFRSPQSDSNQRPADYKSAALAN